MNVYKKGLVFTFTLLLAAAATAKSGKNSGLVLQIRNGAGTLEINDTSGSKNNAHATSLVVSNSPSLVSMTNTHQLTMAAWIRPNSVPSEFPVVISKGGNEAPADYGGYELVLNANGDNDIMFNSGGFDAYTAGAAGTLINNQVGQWIHIAFTIDTDAQAAQFYVNGQAWTNLGTYGNFSDVNFGLTNNLYIGTPDPAANGNRAPFDGDIRQVMIYNRALSADEIQKIYSSTKPVTKK